MKFEVLVREPGFWPGSLIFHNVIIRKPTFMVGFSIITPFEVANSTIISLNT